MWIYQNENIILTIIFNQCHSYFAFLPLYPSELYNQDLMYSCVINVTFLVQWQTGNSKGKTDFQFNLNLTLFLLSLLSLCFHCYCLSFCLLCFFFFGKLKWKSAALWEARIISELVCVVRLCRYASVQCEIGLLGHTPAVESICFLYIRVFLSHPSFPRSLKFNHSLTSLRMNSGF